MARWSKLRGVTLNLQPKRSNLILGRETRLIAGDETIEERFVANGSAWPQQRFSRSTPLRPRRL